MSVQTAIDRIVDEVYDQTSLISQITLALKNKAAGDLSHETWTITLTDGTVVEKEVVLV